MVMLEPKSNGGIKVELKINVDLYKFEKLFEYELKDYTNTQKSDIYKTLVELTFGAEVDDDHISDIIRFGLVRQTHEDVLSDYEVLKEHMEEFDLTFLEALQDHTIVYSYDDEEVVYSRF